LPDLEPQPGHEIARRLELRGSHAWAVVLKPPDTAVPALDAFEDELEVYLGGRVRTVDASQLSMADLREQLQSPPDDVIVLTGLDDFDEDSWTALDINRDGMERQGTLVLWLSSEGALGLCRHAPNLRSFIGGSIFHLGPDGGIMTEQERQRRLADLAAHYKLDNEQVIRLAEARTLPPDPEFVEWLVLLGRGDLL